MKGFFEKIRKVPKRINKFMAMAVTLAIVVSAAAVSYFGNRQTVSEAVLISEGEYFLEERAQINEISDYLDSVDEIVQNSQTQLSEAGPSAADIEAALAELHKNLSILEQNISAVGAILDFSTKAYIDENATEKELLIDAKNRQEELLIDAKNRQEEIGQQLNSTLSTTNVLLWQMNQENQNGFNAIQAGITKTLSAFSDVDVELSALRNAVTEIRSETISFKDSLNQVITSMQSGNEEGHGILQSEHAQLKTEHAQLQSEHAQLQTGQAQLMTDHAELLEVQEELLAGQADLLAGQEDLTDDIGDLADDIDDLSDDIGDLEDGHTEIISNLQMCTKNIESQLKAESLTLQLALSQDYTSLVQKLDSLHDQISNSELYIAGLLTGMDAQAGNRQKEIKTAFVTLTTYLKQINTDFTAAHNEISNLVITLRQSEDAHNQELLLALTDMETRLNAEADQNFNGIISSLQTVQTNFDDSIANMQNEMNNNLALVSDNVEGSVNSILHEMVKSFVDLNNEMYNQFIANNNMIKERLDQVNNNISNQYDSVNGQYDNISNQYENISDQFNGITNQYENISDQFNGITNQYENITNNISASDDGVQNYLEMMMETISREHQMLFQSVSNGKRLLASALLTKGMEIDAATATFNDYKDAILNIPTNIEIGDMPGEISYLRHNHVNKAGELTGTATTQSENGGCFITPVYHAHTDSCYSVCNVTYARGCHNSWEEYGRTYVCQVTDRHSSCGAVDRTYTIRHANNPSSHKTTGHLNTTHYALSCTSGNTILGWAIGCGMVEDQIIGANIVYDTDAATNLSAVQSVKDGDFTKTSPSVSDDTLLDEAGMENAPAGKNDVGNPSNNLPTGENNAEINIPPSPPSVSGNESADGS